MISIDKARQYESSAATVDGARSVSHSFQERSSLPRIGVICDLLEERWPSMDLVADMLLKHLTNDYSDQIAAARICPPLRRRFTGAGNVSAFNFNADRFMNRFWDYPREVRKKAREFDLFHVIDHSYSQLVHELPTDRAIVTCHDLDTFRCLLEPERDRRGPAFKAMARRILRGFRKAARVTCDSVSTRDDLLKHGLLPPERVVVVNNGVHPACSPSPDPAADMEAARLLGPIEAGTIDLLHVGSTIARKRIDVLLRVFAVVVKENPAARLIRVGGEFTAEQAETASRFGVDSSIVVLPFLDRRALAAVYRRAALVLVPSESEGFGLPVAEAMACAVPVVASDLPVLKEVGADVARYCAVADVATWSAAISELLCERREDPDRWFARRMAGVRQAGKFSWAEYAKKMVELYREVLDCDLGKSQL